MTLARYFVFKLYQKWLVTFEGRVLAQFATKPAALDSARGMANLMGAMQYDADVMLEEAGKLLRQVWIYGKDKLLTPARRRAGKRAKTAPPPASRSLTVLGGEASPLV